MQRFRQHGMYHNGRYYTESALAHLPIDIMACVIDEMADDRPTLLACSLVSKTWARISRATLFHTVTLNSEKRAERLEELIRQKNGLAQCVQVLIISARKHSMRTKTQGDLQSWIPRHLPFFAETLLSVGSLHFEDVQWDTLQGGLDPQFRASLGNYMGVKDLHFYGCKFSSFMDFELIVQSFARSVTRVSLRSMTWLEPQAFPGLYYLPIQTLTILSGCNTQLIYSWLTRLQAGRPNGPLKTLEFNEVHDTELPQLGWIIRDMGQNLQTFKIGVQLMVDGKGRARRQDVEKWLPLQDSIWLRYLTIRVITCVPEHMIWIQNLLRLINEGSLHTLTFHVWLGLPGQVYGRPWDDIAWLISETPRFASLQQVRFVHHGSLDIDIVRYNIQRQFHLLHSCGKLVIVNKRNPALFR